MSLDYSDGCVNFRDVGEWVNLIAGEKLLYEKRLYRGGKLDHINSPDDIGNTKTIVNLRRGEDKGLSFLNAKLYHCYLGKGIERSHTHLPEVKKWLREVVSLVAYEIEDFPVLFHCTSGKDRTGIVIAVLLRIMNIPLEIVIEEYMLSDGKVDKDEVLFALKNIEPVMNHYFHGIDLNLVRKKILYHPV